MSELRNKDNILYRPELGYDKNYDTTGTYVTENIEQDSTPSQQSTTIEELINSIERLESAAGILPQDMQEIIKKPLSAIKHVIGDVDGDGNKPDGPSYKIQYKPKHPEDVRPDDDFPDNIFTTDEDPFNVIVGESNKIKVIQKTYEYDLVSIITDYIDKLEQSVSKYTKTVMSTFKGLDASNYNKVTSNYNLSCSEVDIDYKHLSDIIVRSQVAKKMKIRMYNKLFGIDKTISHIRKCKIALQQRIRYYEASYQEMNSLDNVVNNKLLESSRALYDAKYKQNFINLYKYLNSSVMLFNECLMMSINEAQAKSILLKKEGTDLW